MRRGEEQIIGGFTSNLICWFSGKCVSLRSLFESVVRGCGLLVFSFTKRYEKGVKKDWCGMVKTLYLCPPFEKAV